MTDKELRFRVLQLTNESSSNGRLPLQTEDYVRLLYGEAEDDEATLRQVGNALTYLHDKGLINASAERSIGMAYPMYFVSAITAKGIDLLERGEQSAEIGRPVHNFYGTVGAVLSGDHNIANVTQHIGVDQQRLIDALITLQHELGNKPDFHAVRVLSDSAIAEVKKHGVTDSLKSNLSAIATLIQTAGAANSAYGLLYHAAVTAGINGLPPPTGP